MADAKLEFIGANGSVIDLFHNDYYQVSNIDGMTSATAEITSTVTPGLDGDTINSATVQPRSIILDLRVRNGVRVEDAKRWLMYTVKPKLSGRLRLTQPDRTTEISGIVESIEMPRFYYGVTCQVTLHCSQPYWQDAEYLVLEISHILDLHYFPVDDGGLAFPADGVSFGEYNLNNAKSYFNSGDAETGAIITIVALGNVTNPIIYNGDGKYIGVIDSMVEGDVIEINTNRGEKSIKKNGVSIFSRMKSGSTFLQLAVGNNSFVVDADSGEDAMYFMLTFKRRFV